jgi:hypothetical protein
MPYRRLPNTDVARIKALKLAFIKGKELPPFKLAFSQATLQKVQSFLPLFESAILEYKQNYMKQTENNANYQKEAKKARLYVSHFIQVVNMAVMRGDVQESVKAYYGINGEDNRVPSLQTEADLIKWGKSIIEGEKARTMKGQSPITNPTIAVVKVRYEKFLELHRFQKMLQKNVQRTQEKLNDLRIEADRIILNLWNEIEDYHKEESDKIKRSKSSIYGVVYVFRKNELKDANIQAPVPAMQL